MASAEHIHVRRQRGHCHIIPSEISTHQHREKAIIARRSDILVTKHRLPGQWACQLCQDCYKILAETSVGTEWLENTSGEYNPLQKSRISQFCG